MHLQALFKAYALERQVVLERADLVRQRNQFRLIGSQRVPQQATQLSDHFLRAAWIFGDQLTQVVQAVEKKVGIELPTQATELSLLGDHFKTESSPLCVAEKWEFVDSDEKRRQDDQNNHPDSKYYKKVHRLENLPQRSMGEETAREKRQEGKNCR